MSNLHIDQRRFTIGIFGIIFDDRQQVLLCHRRDYDLWNLPGGGLENGESPWEAVVREVREETGLTVRVDRLAGMYHKPEKDEIVFSFVCRITGGAITATDEADQIEYFAVDAIPNRTSPKQVERIHDAIEHDTCVMKMQTGPSSIEMIKQGKW